MNRRRSGGTRQSLMALCRGELTKVSTARGTTTGLVALMATLAVLSVGRVTRGAGTAGGVRAGSDDAWLQVLGSGMAPGLLVVLVGVLSATGELRHRSLTATLLVTPRRDRVVLAKVLASGLLGGTFTAMLGLGAAAYGMASGVLRAPLPAGDVARIVAGAILVACFWAWLGVAIGLLVRQQAAAVALPLVWLVVVETLVTSYGLGPLRWWLPGGAASALGGADDPAALPAWLAAAVLTGYCLALTAAGLRRLVVADVT